MTPTISTISAAVDLRLDRDFRSDIERRDFRDAMASLAANACVVTARGGEERLGRTVTAAMSLSVEPPAILVSIDAASPLAALIRREQGFSFAMLSETQQAVADAFAGKLPPEERFDAGSWGAWQSGQPRLDEAVAIMDCAVIGEIGLAGHILFAGGVRDIALDYSRSPLVWHHRRYNSVYPL
ncbi:flavin reductase family protein [Salipiger abyssi]|uniref:flavin reductase family protein n=1 Tax=Salipiger abyssi TaxID=1250539 RepID=UPI004057FA5C